MKTLKSTLALLAAFALTFNAVAQTNLSPRANNVSVEITIEDGTVQILWNTNKEVNSSYFLIEKSTDSIHFTAVKMIKAAGKSDFVRNYEYSETADVVTKVFYRVTLVTMNGEQIASVPASVKSVNTENIASK
ncbi:MAG: hypothetical protein WC150_07140 [Bacteroidia bacterium]